MNRYGNYYPPFSLRISDELLAKIKYLAQENHRSTNKQLEFILASYVEQYEAAHGPIPVQQEP